MCSAPALARSLIFQPPNLRERRRVGAASIFVRLIVSRSHDAHLRLCEPEVPVMIPTRGNAHVSYEQRSVGVFEEVQGNVFTAVCSNFHHTSASMCKCCVVSGFSFSFLAFLCVACVRVGVFFYLWRQQCQVLCMINYNGQLITFI